MRICEAKFGIMFGLRDGDGFARGRACTMPPAFAAFERAAPHREPDPGIRSARVATTNADVVHIADYRRTEPTSSATRCVARSSWAAHAPSGRADAQG